MISTFKHLLPKLVATALRSPHKMKHSAVIVDRGGNPFCFDFNREYLHAERGALRKLAKLPWCNEAYAIVVIRVNKTGLAESKPCSRCQAAIDVFGLKVIHSKAGG